MSIDVLAPPKHPEVRPRYSPVALGCVAVVTLGAAVIHLAAVPQQLAEYPLFGVLFIGVALAQTALAVSVVWAPGRRLFAGAAVGTMAVLALWLISRSTGLPFGPAPGSPEPIGVPDVVCVALELVSVLILLVLAARGPAPRRARPAGTALAIAPIVLVVAAATFVGVGTGLSGMPAMSAAPPSSNPATPRSPRWSPPRERSP